jgi:hypothetical protein
MATSTRSVHFRNPIKRTDVVDADVKFKDGKPVEVTIKGDSHPLKPTGRSGGQSYFSATDNSGVQVTINQIPRHGQGKLGIEIPQGTSIKTGIEE